METLNPLDQEQHLTVDEIAAPLKLHRETVRRLFVNEPGVVRIGHAATKSKRRYFTLRIPPSVRDRVFARMAVQGTK